MERSLDALCGRYAVHEPVAARYNWATSSVRDVLGVIDGNEVYKDEDVEFRLRDGATPLLPALLKADRR